MSFILNRGTAIIFEMESKPVQNTVNILKRDIDKVLTSDVSTNTILLKERADMAEESYLIDVGADIVIYAADELGFVYALLHISEKYLGIKPFWFWLDQRIEPLETVEIPFGSYTSPKPVVRYRGWFFNDEVLLLKWNTVSEEYTWRMAFEALLRCGGNMTIPGTDKMSRKNRKLASEMGLWITHHHAEPLGAEMFAREYPGVEASFEKNPERFYKLWEDAVIAQKECKVVWNLCFRGQGDKPFWSDDNSGKYDTPERRGALIGEVIKKQCDIVKKYVNKPVFCTNLYGEVMELYKQGHIRLDDNIIKVRADNGYGKMVTRRRDNHDVRVASMPEQGSGRQGIYYHVSFYDLQAANHITMLPNSVDFVDRELSAVLDNDGGDFWVINCSNVRPHAYFLDAVRKKWYGETTDSSSHSRQFAESYYPFTPSAAKCLADYADAMIQYGENEDEHAGEQFYTENSRLIAHHIIVAAKAVMPQLKWLCGDVSFAEQVKAIRGLCERNIGKLETYLAECEQAAGEPVFESTVLLAARIHFYCAKGLLNVCDSALKCGEKDYVKAFILAGAAAEWFDRADSAMRGSEYGIWQGFYANDCFADISHSAYMARKLMSYIRELGDNPRHDKWYRDFVYPPEDRDVFLLLVTDKHMTDEELYLVMKEADFSGGPEGNGDDYIIERNNK